MARPDRDLLVMLAIALVAILFLGVFAPRAGAADEWWRVDTDSRTTAEVRAVFVERLRDHRREVREVRLARRAHVLALKRLAEAAAAAVDDAQAALDSTTYSSSYAGPDYVSEATVASAMRAAGFPESEVAWFIDGGIIDRESNYCTTAVYPGHCGDVSLMVSGGPACSLFQLFTCPGPQVADPYVAARYAFAKWSDGGRSHWGG